MNDIEVTTPSSTVPFANEGINAFPVITSNITIRGAKTDGTRSVIRRTGTTDFRFFFVDAATGQGRLLLDYVELTGGGSRDGGAIFVDGSTSSTDEILVLNNSILRALITLMSGDRR